MSLPELTAAGTRKDGEAQGQRPHGMRSVPQVRSTAAPSGTISGVRLLVMAR